MNIFIELPIIETKRLLLRKIEIKDTDDVFAFTSNPITSEWLTWHPHKTKEDTLNFIKTVMEKYQRDQPAQWAIELKPDKKIIGLCGFVNYFEEHSKGEVAYVLSPDYWGKGFLPEALEKIIEFSFKNWGLIRIEAKCEVGNFASERVMQKVGMRQEGLFIKYLIRKGESRNYKLYAIINDKK
jgi:[ribosomal protein S5]-alanine N-acetyltransferase